MARIEEKLNTALATGLVDLRVRVSRYEDDMVTPAAWQAIAVYRDVEKGPWGTGIRASMAAAIEAALDEGERLHGPKADNIVEGIFG